MEFNMAFDGLQSTFENSLQAAVFVSGGNGGSVAMPFVPSASLQEQDTTSYVPWSHNTQDDPYDCISWAQNSIKSRKLTDKADCGREVELEALVSSILDDADSQNIYYSEGSPTCHPIWSLQTLGEELPHYFQSEAKMQHNPNYVYQETFSKAQQQSVDRDVEELSQQLNGFSHHPEKLPPGLPMPNTGNTYPSQIQQSKSISMSVYDDRRNGQPMNHFPDLSDVFRPQSEMKDPCFDPTYENHYIQSSLKPICNEEYVQEDINQLVSSFQPFIASENDSVCRGNLPNMRTRTVGMHLEDSIAEQWKISSPSMSTQGTPAMQIPKQLVEEFGAAQRKRNGVVRKQTFQRDAFQHLPDVSPQNTEYFQQPKPFMASLNLPNQYPSKMTMHDENINVSSQYSNHHIQQSQMKNKIKQQMQKEKKTTHMCGFLGEDFARQPQTNSHMRKGNKLPFSQNPYCDLQGSVQSRRFDGENRLVSTANGQFMPFMYPETDLRRHSSTPMNFSSESTLPYESGVPALDVGYMMSANESAAFNSYVSDTRTRRVENTYHGMASAMTASVLNQGEPVIQCYEQWRCLREEREMMEVNLMKTFFGKRTAEVTNINLPKTSAPLKSVSQLNVYLMRDQVMAAHLLDRMEHLSGIPLHVNIHTALKRHHMAICIMQERCKEDIAKGTKHQWQRMGITEDRDTLLKFIALMDLAAATRKLRTALWCALQMILPKPVKTQDDHVNKEAARTERCSSPIEGYSFKL